MRPQAGKDKIVTAALMLFAEKGFHATSMAEVAAAAGVSKGLAYNYFASKDALLLAIIEQATGRMIEVASTLNLTGGYQVALHGFLDQYGRSLKENHTYLTFQLSLLFQPDLKLLAAQPLRDRANQLLAMAQDMFTRAGAPHPSQTARRFISELDGIALHYLSVFEDYPLDDMLVQLYTNYKDLGK